jgi:hypothetical protein
MESHIAILAAFIFAHDQAAKGMLQLSEIIEYGTADKNSPSPTAVNELVVLKQVCSHFASDFCGTLCLCCCDVFLCAKPSNWY